MVEQLINQGISEAIEEMKKVTEEFFQLPLEEKMDCAQLPNNLEGYGQTFVVSEDQKLDWGDMLFLFPLPVSQRNMRFWPTTPTAFRYTKHCQTPWSREKNRMKSLLKYLNDCNKFLNMIRYVIYRPLHTGIWHSNTDISVNIS